MKYLKRIYNNIKYLLYYDLKTVLEALKYNVDDNYDKFEKRIDDNYDTLNDKCYDLDNSIDDVSNDLENKLSYDDVVDCIYDNPNNDMQDDITKLETLCDVLKDNNDLLMANKDNNDNSIDNLIERDLLIDEVIKSIINRLDKNENV